MIRILTVAMFSLALGSLAIGALSILPPDLPAVAEVRLDADPQKALDARPGKQVLVSSEHATPFKIVPGLKDSGFVSFEAVGSPGVFMRHQRQVLFLHQRPEITNLLFEADASFKIIRVDGDGQKVRLQASSFHGMFVTVRDDGAVILSKNPPSEKSTFILKPVNSIDAETTAALTGSPSIAAKRTAVSGARVQSNIEVLKEQAPNAVEWALSPLDRTISDETRQNLMLLREDLLDEEAKNPAASAAAYKLGTQLCNDLIETLNEREKMRVRAGYTAVQAKANMGEVTNQALEARRSAKGMSWPVYEREKDQRDELRKQKENGAALEKQRPILEWANRSGEIRRILDEHYANFREAVRRPGAK